VRSLLGGWVDRPADAGRVARRMAIEMARVVLGAGHDVIVPQLIARPELVRQLEQLALDVGVRFVEIALVANKNDVRRWFAERSAHPTSSTHRDADALIARLGGGAALDRLHDDLTSLLTTRPHAVRIAARAGDVEETWRELARVLGADGPAPDAR
jgi:hypothetical protein